MLAAKFFQATMSSPEELSLSSLARAGTTARRATRRLRPPQSTTIFGYPCRPPKNWRTSEQRPLHAVRSGSRSGAAPSDAITSQCSTLPGSRTSGERAGFRHTSWAIARWFRQSSLQRPLRPACL